jgi:hypothetical protein
MTSPTSRAIVAVVAAGFGIMTVAFGALSLLGGVAVLGWTFTVVGTVMVVAGTAGFISLRRRYITLWGTSPDDDEREALARAREVPESTS